MSLGEQSIRRAGVGAKRTAEEKGAAQFLLSVRLADVDAGKLPAAKEVEALAASIEAHGVIEPPVLLRTETGKLRLLSGKRRFAALTALGRTEALCVVTESAEKFAALSRELGKFARAVSPAAESVSAPAGKKSAIKCDLDIYLL